MLSRRRIALQQAERIDFDIRVRRMRDLDNLQHPFDRHKPRPRPMTKAEFRAAVMRELGIEGDTHD